MTTIKLHSLFFTRFAELSSRVVGNDLLQAQMFKHHTWSSKESPIFLASLTTPHLYSSLYASYGLVLSPELKNALEQKHGYSLSLRHIINQIHFQTADWMAHELKTSLSFHVQPPLVGTIIQKGTCLRLVFPNGSMDWLFLDGFQYTQEGREYA